MRGLPQADRWRRRLSGHSLTEANTNLTTAAIPRCNNPNSKYQEPSPILDNFGGFGFGWPWILPVVYLVPRHLGQSRAGANYEVAVFPFFALLGGSVFLILFIADGERKRTKTGYPFHRIPHSALYATHRPKAGQQPQPILGTGWRERLEKSNGWRRVEAALGKWCQSLSIEQTQKFRLVPAILSDAARLQNLL